MFRFLFLIIFAISSAGLKGQDPGYLELVKAENQLNGLFRQLYSDEMVNQEDLLREIGELMPVALSLEGAMEYPWSRLERIGVRTSDDRQIRIFTWHVEDNPEQYRYFGYIQVAGRRGKINVFPLVDNGIPQRGLYNVDQSPENWYGKLYYGIVTRHVKRRTYYTLLGLDFNNSRSNIKTIEMIEIRWNKPQFEKAVFSNGKDVVDRVVLEYSDQVAISVRYDPRLKMITYDHLVPFHPVYANQFEFYGPDGSFDGLEFEDGIWILREDVDARMPD